ncbi:MAG: hypothetical protein DRJ05_08080 [Bacteroidetes bacterium]|nr:MAG: hypothetical protein DRJ05_08080 [Bacteroidota bacterium]
MTKREKQGLSIINGHLGKKRVYDTYTQSNPQMAKKYLEFISKNTDAQYIKWDATKEKFKV